MIALAFGINPKTGADSKKIKQEGIKQHSKKHIGRHLAKNILYIIFSAKLPACGQAEKDRTLESKLKSDI